jgi:hypothetical protein
MQKTISEWKNKHVEIGKENGYTDEQIAEYKKYIDIIANYHKKKYSFVARITNTLKNKLKNNIK